MRRLLVVLMLLVTAVAAAPPRATGDDGGAGAGDPTLIAADDVPRLSLPESRGQVRGALEDWYGREYRRGREKRLSCRREARDRVRCSVAWRWRNLRYRGHATVYRWIQNDEWAVRFTVRRTDTTCLRKGRRNCRTTDRVEG